MADLLMLFVLIFPGMLGSYVLYNFVSTDPRKKAKALNMASLFLLPVMIALLSLLVFLVLATALSGGLLTSKEILVFAILFTLVVMMLRRK
ncbi:hypothetical protein GCM10010965_27470 [Caldalkalibacillus thermarum]|uniref:hypothetical protein n=1 Tax=Caldalkalibacillus thermarum TaxID=296745 RepID=UPI00166E221E|nr:hypothetical protein [Caldalkalibacillus thermarum]GGK33133.1 hypothetical protein GCM10010965_27470 [Caldalkalibacillus thermarum]